MVALNFFCVWTDLNKTKICPSFRKVLFWKVKFFSSSEPAPVHNIRHKVLTLIHNLSASASNKENDAAPLTTTLDFPLYSTAFESEGCFFYLFIFTYKINFTLEQAHLLKVIFSFSAAQIVDPLARKWSPPSRLDLVLFLKAEARSYKTTSRKFFAKHSDPQQTNRGYNVYETSKKGYVPF
jgi:hypothetical protein